MVHIDDESCDLPLDPLGRRHRSLQKRIPYYLQHLYNKTLCRWLEKGRFNSDAYDEAMLSLRLDEYINVCYALARHEFNDLLKELNRSSPSRPTAMAFDPFCRRAWEHHDINLALNVLEDVPAEELRHETLLVGIAYMSQWIDCSDAVESVIKRDRAKHIFLMNKKTRGRRLFRDVQRLAGYEFVILKYSQLLPAYREYLELGDKHAAGEADYKTRIIKSLLAMKWNPSIRKDVILIHRHGLVKAPDFELYRRNLEAIYGEKNYRIRLDSMKPELPLEVNIGRVIGYYLKAAARYGDLEAESALGDPLDGWHAIQFALIYSKLKRQGIKCHHGFRSEV